MSGARGGLLYLAFAGSLGYLWVTGNLAKLTAYAVRASGGTPSPGVTLQDQKPITLPAYRGAAPGGVVPARYRPALPRPA